MPILKLYANLRKLAGEKELSLSADSIEAALDELIRLHTSLRDVLMDADGLRPHVTITLNGQHVTDLATTVTEGDIVAIFPPIAGGGEQVQ